MIRELATDRLTLRPIGPDDADELLRVFRDAAVRRFLLDDTLVDREWVRGEIRRSREAFEAEGWGLWAARLHGRSRVAGFAGFRHFFDPPELQLLYGLTPDHWGQGLATEAARAVTDYAFDVLGFDRVIAATDVPNQASVRVMERLGMRFERRTDDGEGGTVYYRLDRPREARG